MNTDTFTQLESEVRSYCRSFPVVFDKAEGSWLIGEDGERYLDFFAGAGVLNYGHNNPRLKDALIDYLNGNGIVHSLDMYTVAKRTFLERFNEVILKPRDLEYRVQFPGPTGTNAVESAVKLARKVTGRDSVIAFTNAFHGMTLGSLALSGNQFKRAGAGVPLSNATPMPFAGYLGEDGDTLAYLEAVLNDAGSGVDKPAAIVLETVQAEGGINVASSEWLQRLEKIARAHDIILIVDDIQVGCGRTGAFFSFEEAGIKPDMVTLSKSLSGYGLPLAVVLIRPDLDQWEPGEHNGTFRGHNPAFVTGAAALDFWRDKTLQEETLRKADIVIEHLNKIAKAHKEITEVRGRGLIQGLAFSGGDMAGKISSAAFERGLIIETAGAGDDVLKLLPPLTTSDADLEKGLGIIAESVSEVLAKRSAA
ncbi:MAG TPA: diaminobutyrate--2-oxoglutarate transaminase [Gammaproteobacteria bacterium]|nr:diaminobutyrate--2-oxoglutarate transaminase [Gammaproteobacteria bacterium]